MGKNIWVLILYRDSLHTNVHKTLTAMPQWPTWTALEEHLQRLREWDTHLQFQANTMMEGMENVDLSLWNVEEGELALKIHILMKILNDGRQ